MLYRLRNAFFVKFNQKVQKYEFQKKLRNF